jgi:LysM repeat protein
MINDYYAAIGLDKLGPYCQAPTYAKVASPAIGNMTALNSEDEAENADVISPPEKTKSKTAIAPVASKSKYIIYVVQPGDTLSSIAKQYDVASIAQLKAVNKISKKHVLKVGAKLKVPVAG